MEAELKLEKSLLLELQEAEKVDLSVEGIMPYTVTYDYGGLLTIICC